MHADEFNAEPSVLSDTSRPTSPPPPPPRRPSRASGRRWIVTGATVATMAIVAVGAGSLPGASPLWHFPTTALAQMQTPDAKTAIQQAIKRANDEQVQAIANGDPSVMSDTATPDHYQEMVKTNQDLTSNGVTSINLVKLDFGPVTVNGTTATATTYETWGTSTSDGSTEQSLDTNLYTLVQQNGNWVVQSDTHPSDASGQPAGSTSGQPAGSTSGQTPPAALPNPSQPVPFQTTSRNSSHNWSGYAATSNSHNYTGVTGTWTVPQPEATSAPGVSAAWVGIGGVNSRDLIQAGTQEVVSGTGQSQYQSWIEMLPAASTQIPLNVKPGDSVTVSIDKQSTGANMWQIDFKNNTTGKTYQTTVNYASTQSSAEWVEEAPSGQSGIMPIDDFGSITFSNASATQGGKSVNLSQAGAQPISLLGANGQALAVPSAISSDGASFNVARTDAPAVTTTPRATRGRGAPGRGAPAFPNSVPHVIPFQ
jgi:Peptidase A4 family